MKLILSSLPAGAFIALACMLSVLAAPFGRFAPALAFPVGLWLVAASGSPLFTGAVGLEALRLRAGGDSVPSSARLLGLVYLGNLAGALAAVACVWWLGGLPAGSAAAVATGKAGLGAVELLARGVGCNVLVCVAVLVARREASALGKLAAVFPPVFAFVALGLEHSVADMAFMPLGWLAGAPVGLWDAVRVVALATAGNVVGGALVGVAWKDV